MIDHLLFEVEKVRKHDINNIVNWELARAKVNSKQVINIQVKDVTTTLYQIWIWFRHEM